MAHIGSVIDGKYEILKLIGRGGMSKVYLAMDKRLNKQWAVKEIEKRARDKNNEVIIQSAIAEANMIKRLDHPSLPRIVDIIDDIKVIYVIMDYIEGEPLNKIIEEYGAQPQEVVIEWAKQLCEVLEYLHTSKPSIIYRDMKPANIMLKPDGNLKLIDFGIAREYKEQNLADTVSLGTKGYAAPEQFGGKGQTDPRTDIYCLGVTLYHLVTGHNPSEPPYELYPIRQWNPQLSGGLEKIIQKCTQLNPEDRFQSCAELLYALDHYEEADDLYREKQKAKLRNFSFVTGAAVLFLSLGIFGQAMSAHTNNTDYENTIQLAEKSSSPSGKIDYYLTAIDIKPLEDAAYLGLIDAFKLDANFTVEEEKQLKTKMNPHLRELRKTAEYSNLAFEIGKAYWYYYDYGRTEQNDNQITRITSSIQWFEDAVTYAPEGMKYLDMAKIYRDIGKFNRDITLHIVEASDKGEYQPYWENIKELLAIVDENPDESEIVMLELYKLAMYSMESYARKFKSDGVEESDIRSVYEAVKQSTQEVAVTTDRTEEIKEEVIGRFGTTEKAIDNAYRN
ncbi:MULTISPECIES: serine/threonine protein kinase [Sutcliffiella]|uniref:serine/threonine protein kinase n=1 Tax=Sutcliffiella TaxID=2837511 RepID=UPI0022DD3FEF|nr:MULTISPECIES: serine/threonine-protein kinase [Sutcliffiella]MED4014534.1 serine/threonine-protein kinase [Sutcliffiella cohnii]WBL14603.1 serine/threonine-protein kinase [Sutcliffiella sp. NC1]